MVRNLKYLIISVHTSRSWPQHHPRSCCGLERDGAASQLTTWHRSSYKFIYPYLLVSNKKISCKFIHLQCCYFHYSYQHFQGKDHTHKTFSVFHDTIKIPPKVEIKQRNMTNKKTILQMKFQWARDPKDPITKPTIFHRSRPYFCQFFVWHIPFPIQKNTEQTFWKTREWKKERLVQNDR